MERLESLTSNDNNNTINNCMLPEGMSIQREVGKLLSLGSEQWKWRNGETEELGMGINAIGWDR